MIYKQQKNKNMEMISLFDYLGHAAGMQLGEQVAKVATASGVPMDTRHVSNTKYTGNVLLYPEEFLKLYFKANG